MPGSFHKFWPLVFCLLAGSALGLRAQFGDITDQPSDIIDNFGFPSLSWENLGSIGDLPWDTEVSLRSGYDTNVDTSNINPISSFYSNGALGIAYKLGTPRLQLELDVSGGATYYFSRPGKKTDYSFDLVSAVAYQANPRLSFTFNARVSYLSQPDFLIPGTDAQRVGDYWYSRFALAMNYILHPRLQTATAYSYSALTYVEQELNDASGRVEQNISQSLNFLLVPTTTLVGEIRANPVTYYSADLNTVGLFLLVGFDHRFNPQTVWTFRAGAEGRYEENPVDGSGVYLGPFVDSNFVYRVGERTSVVWNFRYGSEPSGFGNVTIRQTFRTGFIASHGITQRLTAACNLFYQHNYYDQPNVIPDITEQIFSGSLELRFEINRNISLQTVYQYTQDVSQQAPSLEYTRNVIYAGVNFLF